MVFGNIVLFWKVVLSFGFRGFKEIVFLLGGIFRVSFFTVCDRTIRLSIRLLRIWKFVAFCVFIIFFTEVI